MSLVLSDMRKSSRRTAVDGPLWRKGEKVDAMWGDGVYHPATIEEVLGRESYRVKFDMDNQIKTTKNVKRRPVKSPAAPKGSNPTPEDSVCEVSKTPLEVQICKTPD